MSNKHSHHSDQEHDHGDHGHSHDRINPSIATSARGIWAVKWSFVGLVITALIQLAIVYVSHSVALLADTIHNFGDAATAIPLGVAFVFARRSATKRFTYGFGRVEDLAGVMVVFTIFTSAIVAGYESIRRLIHPQTIEHVGWIALASVVGFAGNELVAIFRIKVGEQIKSAALIADGYHARADGYTSLAVLLGASGVALGYPLLDSIVGLIICAVILKITWSSATMVFIRLLDGVEPDVVDEIEHAAHHVAGVKEVSDIRARWIGHRLNAQVTIAVDPNMPVSQAHSIAKQVHHQLRHHLNYLSGISIHVDPDNELGEKHHHRE